MWVDISLAWSYANSKIFVEPCEPHSPTTPQSPTRRLQSPRKDFTASSIVPFVCPRGTQTWPRYVTGFVRKRIGKVGLHSPVLHCSFQLKQSKNHLQMQRVANENAFLAVAEVFDVVSAYSQSPDTQASIFSPVHGWHERSLAHTITLAHAGGCEYCGGMRCQSSDYGHQNVSIRYLIYMWIIIFRTDVSICSAYCS